jgi:hypothetical protein
MKRVLSQAVWLAISTLVLVLPSQAIASISALQSKSAPHSLDVSPSSKALPAVGSIPRVSHSELRRLQTLAQRYNCLTLYDMTGTVYSNQFAFTLNTCLERAQESMSADGTNRLSPADLEAFERLQRRFADEIVQVETQWSSIPPRPAIQQNDPDYAMLQALVNQYLCTPTPPEFWQEPLTQREFAIVLNSCLDKVNEMIAEGRADMVRLSDIQTLQTLQEDFRFEMGLLRGRMDALEAHI